MTVVRDDPVTFVSQLTSGVQDGSQITVSQDLFRCIENDEEVCKHCEDLTADQVQLLSKFDVDVLSHFQLNDHTLHNFIRNMAINSGVEQNYGHEHERGCLYFISFYFFLL